jgi:hypothetical protein
MKKTILFFKKHKITIGAIWGILTTLLSIYWGFYPLEQNPKLTFYQKSKIDLFNINESVDGLQITLNGRDLRKKNLNLKVYKFKLINHGKRDIRAVDYSNEIPFGIIIKHGKIARVSIDKNHKNSISKRILKAKQNHDSTSLIFNKIFIGKSDEITFDLWVEYNEKIPPRLIPIGKIADTSISITDSEESIMESDWAELILFILLVIGSIFIAIKTADYGEMFIHYLKKQFRGIALKKQFEHHYDRTKKSHRLLVKFYSEFGKQGFLELLKDLVDYSQTNKIYAEEKMYVELVDSYVKLCKEGNISHTPIEEYDSDFIWVISKLIESNLAEINSNEEVVVNSSFVEDLKLLIKLIED